MIFHHNIAHFTGEHQRVVLHNDASTEMVKQSRGKAARKYAIQ